MDYTLNSKNFFVTEILHPKLGENGKYAYYIIEKKDLSHKQLTRILPIGYYCGIKDKNATTKQWYCTPNPFEINDIREKNLLIEYKGRSNERLHIGKHQGNKFRIKIKLEENELKKMLSINWNKKKICNYFGDQRFDERTNEFASLIEVNNFENALKFFLCEKSKFDSEKSSEIKKEISDNWGNWEKLVNSTIIPDSKKPIFVLLGKEKDFLKAFSLVEKKSLKQMLKSIQSQRYNLMLHNECLLKKSNGIKGVINEQELLLEATKAFKRKIFVKATGFETQFGATGLTRKTFFEPKKFKTKKMGKDYWLEFELGKGHYATILLIFLQKFLQKA
ncbi:MAG: tRNA pseudouridine(13) synthase TruD [Candidatus ainarchaeum sp.]|nr:tRNA pseudouridine(13) synthase TruD [Candidatus ainarchaeum sp.]